MKNKKHLFHNDNKTKQELLDNIVIEKTCYQDVFEIIRILKEAFNINNDKQVIEQLLMSKANLKESIKIIDKRDKKIYGILIFSHFNISIGSPFYLADSKKRNKLKNMKQINGHSFIIDARLRNTNIDKQMINFNKEFLQQFRMIWCGVDKTINSKEYWKKIGFKELFENFINTS